MLTEHKKEVKTVAKSIHTYLVLLLSVYFHSEVTASPNDQIETIIWKNAPISIAIPVGKERTTSFPVPIDAYIPTDIADVAHATITKDGSIFWKADTEFEKYRVMIEDLTGNSQWIVDLSASRDAPSHPLKIIDDQHHSTATTIDPNEDKNSDFRSSAGSDPILNTIDEVELIRLMARQFYGPERLSNLPPNVSGSKIQPKPVKIHFDTNIKTVIRGRWQTSSLLGTLYGTAIEVTNISELAITPDPNDLIATPLTMGVQNTYLDSAGKYPDDLTYWYIVTDRSLEEVFSQ